MTSVNSQMTDPELAEAHREFLRRMTRTWPRSLMLAGEKGLPTFDEMTQKMTEDMVRKPLLFTIFDRST